MAVAEQTILLARPYVVIWIGDLLTLSIQVPVETSCPHQSLLSRDR